MTVARHRGFVTRVQAGLRQPRRLSSAITPVGTVWHWIGARVRIRSHADCAGVWRGIQDYHMAPGGLGARDGAADIAYTLGVCPHGYVFAGRGAGVRTGANGTADGNQNYYAICAFLGPGDVLPLALLEALLWATLELRRVGGAGDRVRRHREFTGSTCPGPDLYAEAPRWDRRPIPTSSPAQEDDPLAGISDENQELLDAIADQLRAVGVRPSSLAHVLEGWRAIAQATGQDANDPAAVASHLVVADTPQQAALLQGTAKHLAALDPGARPTSVAHVLATHRRAAELAQVPGNDVDALARAITR